MTIRLCLLISIACSVLPVCRALYCVVAGWQETNNWQQQLMSRWLMPSRSWNLHLMRYGLLCNLSGERNMLYTTTASRSVIPALLTSGIFWHIFPYTLNALSSNKIRSNNKRYSWPCINEYFEAPGIMVIILAIGIMVEAATSHAGRWSQYLSRIMPPLCKLGHLSWALFTLFILPSLTTAAQNEHGHPLSRYPGSYYGIFPHAY